MSNFRNERKELKQKLFTIRRFASGERGIRLDKELIELKETYEKLPGFTTWKDFPDRWDIGDPHGVKIGSYTFNEVDARNIKKLQGKDYLTIIHLDQPENSAGSSN